MTTQQMEAFRAATERLRNAPDAPLAPYLADAVNALGDWLIALTIHDVNNARMAWEPQRDINSIFDKRIEALEQMLKR